VRPNKDDARALRLGGSPQRDKRRDQPFQRASGTPRLIQGNQNLQRHRVTTSSPNPDELALENPVGILFFDLTKPSGFQNLENIPANLLQQ
jgi:hypothetical protein